MNVPSEMRALLMDGPDPDAAEAIRRLRVGTVPVPALARDQVLVRIAAAPCNPADLLLLTGRYGIERALPAVPGMEGAGRVVASGGGWIGSYMRGKRVICGGHDATGTWAEYCRVDAKSCLPLRRGLSLEQGATAVANPMTALALVHVARTERHRAIVQTAAAGQLGRMILAVATDAGLPIINVVRRAEQAAILRELGAVHIIDSSQPRFDEELAAESRALGATIALDAVGGELTGRLLAALPPRSSVMVYGALGGDACGGIDPMDLAFGDKRVRGFEIARWMKEVGLLRAFRFASRAQRLVASGAVTTTIDRLLTLDEAREGLLGYVQNMSRGKVLIRP